MGGSGIGSCSVSLTCSNAGSSSKYRPNADPGVLERDGGRLDSNSIDFRTEGAISVVGLDVGTADRDAGGTSDAFVSPGAV